MRRLLKPGNPLNLLLAFIPVDPAMEYLVHTSAASPSSRSPDGRAYPT
ncbi:MAG: hypothetical protein KY464_04580 [Gemmatimonadetes bacterium]|nr:hypothetical protein [Gemmatimonadota bacterium]